MSFSFMMMLGEAELVLADSACHDKGRLARVASYGRWRRMGILMSLTVCRARSSCSASAELLDHGARGGLGAAGVLPRDQLAVLDDVGVKRLVGEGVLPSALRQVVLQAERDGLAALSELHFGPRETSDILVRDQVVAVTEPDVDHRGPFRGRPRRRSCRTRRTR